MYVSKNIEKMNDMIYDVPLLILYLWNMLVLRCDNIFESFFLCS